MFPLVLPKGRNLKKNLKESFCPKFYKSITEWVKSLKEKGLYCKILNSRSLRVEF